MATLGQLERSVMDVLWDASTPLSAYEVQDVLAAAGAGAGGADGKPGGKELAATTLLTVLSRLERKGFVQRERSARPHRYRASESRASYMAELMHEALGTGPERVAVLERFVDGVSPEEARALRKLLGR